MPWVRLDEHALNHVKILTLSHGAFRLWVEGLAHCQKHLTDGAISKADLRAFRYASPARISELTTAADGRSPLWNADGENYIVHDYLQWNDNRAKVLAQREKARLRMDRLRGIGTVCSREQMGEQSPNSARTNGEQTENERCTTTTTTVVPIDQELQNTRARERDPADPRRDHPLDERPAPVVLSRASIDAFDAFFAAYPRKEAKVAALAVWRALQPSPELAAEITAAVRDRVARGWVRDAGGIAYIPHAKRFLAEARWTEPYVAKETPPEPGERVIPSAEETQRERDVREAGPRATPEEAAEFAAALARKYVRAS